MILRDPSSDDVRPGPAAGPITIDRVFSSIAARHPDAIALVDPPNRESFTDGAPRRLTYAQADRVVSAIAAKLRRMGLPTDTIIAIQLPNVAENILAMLGVLRAGMIAAPLPFLWRRADVVTALGRIGAKAIITCGRTGSFDHAHFALRVAAEVFSIRYVCALGANLPDGVVPLDDLFDEPDDLFEVEPLEPPAPFDDEREANGAAHVAVITFDVGRDGIVPVARSHAELLTGGAAIVLEGGLTQGMAMLSTLMPASFAGLSLSLLPWLLTGGTLVLHHPFDLHAFVRQRLEQDCRAVLVPGSVAFLLADAGHLDCEQQTTVIAAWRAPEAVAESTAWREPNSTLVDVSVFGEAGLAASRRGRDGHARPLVVGPVRAPQSDPTGITVAELGRSAAGTIAVRGAMVPRHAFPPGIAGTSTPHFKVAQDGTVDTGHNCRIDAITGAITTTGPPADIVSIGGYRLPLRHLADVLARVDGDAALTVQPDPLLGWRLIGNGANRGAMLAALEGLGINPLVVAAFTDRGENGVTRS